MSTHCTIMLKEKDGTVKGVYCHWDGYVSYMGKLLFEHFNSEEKVREIIEKGAISSLKADLGTEKNDFNNPNYNISIFYHRDRDDVLEIYEAKNEKEFCEKYGEAYNYLFRDGKWFAKPEGGRFILLEKKLKSKKLI